MTLPEQLITDLLAKCPADKRVGLALDIQHAATSGTMGVLIGQFVRVSKQERGRVEVVLIRWAMEQLQVKA